MKKNILSFRVSASVFLSFLMFSALFSAAQSKKVTVTFSNPGDFKRTAGVVSVGWKELQQKYSGIAPGKFKVLNDKGKEVAFQLEYMGASTPQNLLIAADIERKSSASFTIVSGKPAAFSARAGGRYVPERKDDFAWENDKVAFRMYGKALEGTNENAYGIDVWSKRTDGMVIDEWYKKENYHQDAGNGLDYYSVGFTLGAGDIAPLNSDTVVYPKNYRTWKVLDQGPLRFTFQLSYEAWKVGEKSVTVTKIISLDAGSQLNRISAAYTYEGAEVLPVAMGLVKRNAPGVIAADEQNGVIGYWEPEHGQDGITGVGLVLSKNTAAMLRITGKQLLAVSAVRSGVPVVYYAGAAWNKAGRITDAKQWFDYLDTFKMELEMPLQLSLQ